MKILHINSYYSAGKFYKNLFNKQIDIGLDIDVFVPVPNSFRKDTEEYGSYTKISKNHGQSDRIFFHLKHHKILKDILRCYEFEQYNIFHAHSLFTNGSITMKLKQKYKVPYIVAVRNTDVNTFFKKMIHLRSLGIKVLEEADKIIFLSKAYRELVIKTYVPFNLKQKIFNKTIIVPNGIDDFWLKNKVKNKQSPNKNELKLLQVGTINKNKNLTTTLKALDLLIGRGFKPSLTVVGRIEDRSVFDQIKTLNCVNYIEPKPKEDLIKIYRQHDIFVLPSIYESFGLVYPEAMSQGLPVIYTRGQGFDGQFEDGEVGHSVESKNAVEIAKKIEQILDHYELISMKAIKMCELYDWKKIANSYNVIYKDCIKDKEGKGTNFM